MADADVVITGTVLTVDDARPTAEALAVANGRIVAVGSRSDVAAFIGPDTQTVDVGDGCVMPGFIEAHGHPLMEAIALSDRLVDIRPVTMRDAGAVVEAVRREVARRGSDGAYLNGWDSLLQPGLPEPTLTWLDEIAPDDPLVIIHNSGHKAFFNSRAAQRAGLNRDTADPKGARFGRDANGELDGTAEETGAVFPLLNGAIAPSDYPAMLLAECARLNRAGLTTCSEMAFDPALRPLVDGLRGDLTVRLRTYEISNPQMSTAATPGEGDDMLRQVGIKIWVDGSPWIGNIDLSFPYLDTAATRTIGVTPGSCGHANYTREQLAEIVAAYFPLGWPMACHVQGDAGVDTILDIYEEALRQHPRDGGNRFVYKYNGANGVAGVGRFPKNPQCFVPNVPRDPIAGPVSDDFGFGDELAPINAIPKGYVMNGLISAGDWQTRRARCSGISHRRYKGPRG